MKTLVIAVAAAALVAPALAQQPTTPAVPATPPAIDTKVDVSVDAFARIDADKNGALTLAEVKIHDVAVTQADFDKYDGDKSRTLSKAEYAKWDADMKAKATPPTG